MTGPNSNSISVFTDNRSKFDRRVAARALEEVLAAVESIEQPTLVALAQELGIHRPRLYRLLTALGIAETVSAALAKRKAR